jgi:hypothetical protein
MERSGCFLFLKKASTTTVPEEILRGDAKGDEGFEKSVSLAMAFFAEVLAVLPLLRHHGA